MYTLTYMVNLNEITHLPVQPGNGKVIKTNANSKKLFLQEPHCLLGDWERIQGGLLGDNVINR